MSLVLLISPSHVCSRHGSGVTLPSQISFLMLFHTWVRCNISSAHLLVSSFCFIHESGVTCPPHISYPLLLKTLGRCNLYSSHPFPSSPLNLVRCHSSSSHLLLTSPPDMSQVLLTLLLSLFHFFSRYESGVILLPYISSILQTWVKDTHAPHISIHFSSRHGSGGTSPHAF